MENPGIQLFVFAAAAAAAYAAHPDVAAAAAALAHPDVREVPEVVGHSVSVELLDRHS